jgi:hypothetical protein
MKKVPFFDVVLMLVREEPGLTRPEIGQRAITRRVMRSLLLKNPLAAKALFLERFDFTKPTTEGAERAINVAYSLGYVTEDDNERFRITAAGQTLLRENSGL